MGPEAPVRALRLASAATSVLVSTEGAMSLFTASSCVFVSPNTVEQLKGAVILQKLVVLPHAYQGAAILQQIVSGFLFKNV